MWQGQNGVAEIETVPTVRGLEVAIIDDKPAPLNQRLKERIKDWSDIHQIERPVILREAFVDDGVSSHNIETGYDAVMDEATDKVWYMGKNYMPVQNKDINTFIEQQFLDKGFEFMSAYFNSGRTTWSLIHPDVEATFNVNGHEFKSKFMVNINNSYDGSSRVSINIGGKINYCQNLFGLPTKRAQGGLGLNISSKHLRGVNGSQIFLEQAEEQTETKLPVLKDFYQNTVNNKAWNVMPSLEIYNRLNKEFPTKNEGEHQTVVLAEKTMMAERTQWGTDDFSWFMALTNMSTFPEKYGLSETAAAKLGSFANKTFLAG